MNFNNVKSRKKRIKIQMMMKMRMKMNPINHQRRIQMKNQKMKMKNLTLLLSKMIIRILKGLKRYVSMTKKQRRMLVRNRILRNREIRPIKKLRTLINNSIKLKINSKITRRRSCLKSTSLLSVILFIYLRQSIPAKQRVNLDCKKIFHRQFFLPIQHLIDYLTVSKS